MPSHPGVHLIGSVAMPDAESVFRALAGELGPWLRRIPDGETGERHRWIYWQREMLLRHPDMEIDPTVGALELKQWDGSLIRNTELVRFRPGVDPAGVTFETGYAPAAIASYAIFRRLREEGTIPAGVRFQVCLPTPTASGYMYVSPKALADYLPAYERALLAALDAILAAIPHADLSIQWDVCQEVLIFENYFPWRAQDYKAEIAGELARLRRRLDFLHLPVPKDRSDAAYFAPLAGLKIPQDTTLYLGLIHHDDAAGDAARTRAARAVVPAFGIATECGWGRTDPARVPGLIAAHRQAMQGHDHG